MRSPLSTGETTRQALPGFDRSPQADNDNGKAPDVDVGTIAERKRRHRKRAADNDN